MQWYQNCNSDNVFFQLEAAEVAAGFDNSKAAEAREFDWQNFEDALLKREFAKIVDIGYAILPPPQYRRVSNVLQVIQPWNSIDLYGVSKHPLASRFGLRNRDVYLPKSGHPNQREEIRAIIGVSSHESRLKS